MHSKQIRYFQLLAGLFFLLFGLVGSAVAATLTESFTSARYFDSSNSTGHWNIIDNRAQAAVVVDDNSAQSISFGGAALGALSVSSGTITFDTDATTSFEYESITIDGTATISVTGSNPLVLRSLGAVTISRAISLAGGAGSTGAAGGAGGTAIATSASGGAGGLVTVAPQNGSDGGGAPAGTGGASSNNPAANASNGNPAAAGFNALNFFAAGFVAMGGGGGGGAHTDGGVVSPAVGGGGGAGGGLLRIVAGGLVNITGAISVNGGAGAVGQASASTFCSGAGAGGNGGAVWIQSYKGVTAPNPNINPGAGGGACGTLGAASPGVIGDARVDNDTATGIAAPVGDITVVGDTADAAASQTYVVQSLGYDTLYENPKYESANVTASTPGTSTVSVQYAGSADNSSFSSFVSDITQLSNANYRYIKFRVSFTTQNVAGVSPAVSGITITYSALPPLGYYPDSANLDLSAGCGALKFMKNTAKDSNRGGDGASPLKGILFMLPWLAGAAAFYRAVRNTKLLD